MIYDGIFCTLQDGNHHKVVRQPSRCDSDKIKIYALDVGLEKARYDVGCINN